MILDDLYDESLTAMLPLGEIDPDDLPEAQGVSVLFAKPQPDPSMAKAPCGRLVAKPVARGCVMRALAARRAGDLNECATCPEVVAVTAIIGPEPLPEPEPLIRPRAHDRDQALAMALTACLGSGHRRVGLAVLARQCSQHLDLKSQFSKSSLAEYMARRGFLIDKSAGTPMLLLDGKAREFAAMNGGDGI